MKQAIILAAGRGTRLGPRAAGGPKCLVPVAGRPILEHQITALLGAAVSDIMVVTGFEADQVREAATRYGGKAVRFAHNERYAETNVLASWMIGSKSLSGGHFFLHGDTVFEPALLDRLKDTSPVAIELTVDRHKCAEEEMKVRVQGDSVVQISKLFDATLADGEFTGIMAVGGEIFPDLRATGAGLLASPDGDRLFVEAALQKLIDERPGSVRWRDVSGLRWREIDFEEDWAAADAMFAGA